MSELNNEEIKTCYECEWCIPQMDLTHTCSLRGEQTQLTNYCLEYDYCQSYFYAGA